MRNVATVGFVMALHAYEPRCSHHTHRETIAIFTYGYSHSQSCFPKSVEESILPLFA
jgi:hypothetical protein